jgi:transcription termination/antitermination protein NusA
MTTKMTSVARPELRQVNRHGVERQPQSAGVPRECALHEIPGVAASMLAAFGNNGINSVEDLAACATDDLLGWTERSGRKVIIHPGILGGMEVSRTQCDAIILYARVRLGWIEPSILNS